MTQKEKKQFVQVWQELENIVTTIDPHFEPDKKLKRPSEVGPEELKFLLQLLRVQVKIVLHSKESAERERDTFYKILTEQGAVDE